MHRVAGIVAVLCTVVAGYSAMAAAPCTLHNDTEYDCRHLNYTAKDIGAIPTNATLIDLTGNLIVNLTDNLFKNFTALETLTLDSNKIALVSEGAFSGCTKLANLSLAANKISELKTDTFKDTPLTALSLSNNSFDALPENAFAGLTNLQTLYLQFLNTAGKLQNLSSLVLGDNFKNMTALTYLYMQGNGIQAISNDSFENVNDKLNELHLCNNELTAIKKGTFDRFKSNLTFLCLYENKLTEIENDTFSGLQALTEINMDNNAFKAVPASVCAPKMQTLSMGGFRGESLTGKAFQGCGSLKTLSLASSSLKTIGKAFQNLKITSLDLSDNKMLEIGDAAAFTNTTKLVELNLRGMGAGLHNSFYSLPRAVTAVNLTLLDVTFSRYVTFSKADTVYFNTLTTLKAFNNSFNCACKNIDFMAWFLVNAKSIPAADKPAYTCATCDDCDQLPMPMTSYNMSQCNVAPKQQRRKVTAWAVGSAFVGLAVGVLLTVVVVFVLVKKQRLCFRSIPYSNVDE